jgi:hypothetical protein
LVRQLHRHILRGVGSTLHPAHRPVRPFFSPSRSRREGSPGGLACTTSPSAYRR